MFKTSWNQLEQDSPIIYVKYVDVVELFNAVGPNLEALKRLPIYTDSVVARHRTPSYGSD